MDIWGAYCKLHTDKALYNYFVQHYRHFFPKLSERSLFVPQAANLWQCKAAVPRRLTCLSGQAHDPVQPIDTLPLPVCTDTRAPRDPCFAGQADYGYCAAKDLHDYGFKLGLRISRCGMSTKSFLLELDPAPAGPRALAVKSRHTKKGALPPLRQTERGPGRLAGERKDCPAPVFLIRLWTP